MYIIPRPLFNSMLSTIHQRHMIEVFQKEKSVSLDRLKELFVDTKTMNQTTLYRILDRWKEQHVVHEIEIEKKRIFLLCQHAHENEGIKISYCTRCEAVSESHFPIAENTARAEMVEYLKCCNQCQ